MKKLFITAIILLLNVTFFSVQAQDCNAGADASACGSPYSFYNLLDQNATASGGTVSWSSSGDGWFQDLSGNGSFTVLSPLYHIGPADRTNGSAIITLTVTAADNTQTTSSFTLTLVAPPTAIIDPILVNPGDGLHVCAGGSYSFSNAEVAEGASISWQGNGDGSFNNDGIQNPIYTPGPQDIANGYVDIDLNVMSYGEIFCNNRDEVRLVIDPIIIWYHDADSDGYGDPAVSQTSCSQPSGYVSDNTDNCVSVSGKIGSSCNDNNVCTTDDVLNASCQCEGTPINVDDDNACTTDACDALTGVSHTSLNTLWYHDQDNDGYGDASSSVSNCVQPNGYVTNNTDCSPSNASLYRNGEFFTDADGDGYTVGSLTTVCYGANTPSGYATTSLGTDCDDATAAANPAAAEICDGIDNNCDNLVDNGLTFVNYYTDTDNDGYGAGTASSRCSNPGAGFSTNNTDCNDATAAANPAAAEICDGIDNDCDNLTDEGCATPTQLSATFCNKNLSSITTGITAVTVSGAQDYEFRLYKTGYDQSRQRLASVPGVALSAGIPLPAFSGLEFGATYNVQVKTKKNNLWSQYGPVCTVTMPNKWYKDTDNDGYSNGTTSIVIVGGTTPVGYKLASALTAISGDCNDNNAALNPGATEACNGLDDNCNGTIDEGCPTLTRLTTAFCNTNITSMSVTLLANAVSGATDFEFRLYKTGYDQSKVRSVTNPGTGSTAAMSLTNFTGLEFSSTYSVQVRARNSNLWGNYGTVCTITTPKQWYKDADNDMYSDGTILIQHAQPVGYKLASNLTALIGDCNDNNPAVNPAATEVCNGIDDDCDNLIDENVKTTYYADSDEDGFGALNSSVEACTVPTGYVTNSLDCDDQDQYRNPSITEICNETDDNCDGTTDEGLGSAFYADSDGDGFGDENQDIHACDAPPGFVADNTDCDDSNSDNSPSAIEICDGVDNDCNNDIDEGVLTTYYFDEDVDGYGGATTTEACSLPDGYTEANDDCDDSNGDVFPEGVEICNLIDDNCDNQIDEGVQTTFYSDQDEDTYGDLNNTTLACTLPTGYVTNTTDCDDNDAIAHEILVWYHDNDADGYDFESQEDCGTPGANWSLTAGTMGDCDDADPIAHEELTWYYDFDGDEYSSQSEIACGTPGEHFTLSVLGEDCDDNDAVLNPTTVWFKDADNDLYSDGTTQTQCAQPTNYKLATALTATSGDCNDNNAVLNPTTVWYKDADNDLYSDGTTQTQCAQPTNFKLATALTATSGDCNDNDAVLNPTTVWYRDADNDAYSNGSTITQCAQPVDHKLATALTALSGDCNDAVSTTNPGAPEICGNGIDDNCNGQTDEKCTKLTTSYCGTTVALGDIISCVSVSGATNYEYRFVNSAAGYSQSFQRGNGQNTARPNYISGLPVPATYQVSVRAFVGGRWGEYGDACALSISTATQLTPASCGATIATINDFVYIYTVTGATNYEYRFVHTASGFNQTYQRGSLSASMKPSSVLGLVGGRTYTVTVRAFVNGSWGSFSTPCSLTITSALKLEESLEDGRVEPVAFDVNAYPNPFSSTLNISHNATGHEVNIQMVDLVGKLVYEAKTTASEITIGNGLAKGLYHVTVTVGDQRKVLRVMKE